MAETESRQGRPRSVRFSFAFDDAGIRLIGRCLRQKPALRGDDVRTEPPPNAVTVELESRAGVVLYRQTLISPIPQTVEVIGPGSRLSRQPLAPGTGAFTMVVPNLDDAVEVVLSRGPSVELRQRAFALRAGGPRVRQPLVTVPFERG